MSAGATTLVMPAYNEAERLDGAALLGLLDRRPEVTVLAVDDGSTDATAARLGELAAARPRRLEVLANPRNLGKAESVRRGLLQALEGPAALVGYFDADLSTPPEEIGRLLDAAGARGDSVSVVMGARVALLGTDIRRRAVRHYLGRVFASMASQLLDARVYDTQCGAKLFRRSPALAAALADPFRSRWAFDVELLGRLLIGTAEAPGVPTAAMLEVPLGAWHDVPGSKLSLQAMAGTLKDLALIAADLRARRRRAAAGARSSR
jgi:glycosyltransferase involved in cell wall biosynthesis